MRLTFVKPMEPELVDQPPKGDGWSHEVKFDGYRTQLIKDDDGIRLYTKTGILCAAFVLADVVLDTGRGAMFRSRQSDFVAHLQQ